MWPRSHPVWASPFRRPRYDRLKVNVAMSTPLAPFERSTKRLRMGRGSAKIQHSVDKLNIGGSCASSSPTPSCWRRGRTRLCMAGGAQGEWNQQAHLAKARTLELIEAYRSQLQYWKSEHERRLGANTQSLESFMFSNALNPRSGRLDSCLPCCLR